MKKLAFFGLISISLVLNLHATETNNTSEIIVYGNKIQEEQLIGPYQQPEWTTERRFPSTRIYLQEQPYEMGVEQWDRIRSFKDGTVEHRFSEEFEMGLPHHFQMDVYYTWKYVNQYAQPDEESIEFRYAFADWGKIILNPTLYVEYTFATHGEPDALEGKLLLGDITDHGYHYGVNLICEQGLWGSRFTELSISAALGRMIFDKKLSLGAETRYEHTTEVGLRDSAEEWFMLGPSIQWRITPKIHFDCAPLFGLNNASPNVECWVVMGCDM